MIRMMADGPAQDGSHRHAADRDGAGLQSGGGSASLSRQTNLTKVLPSFSDALAARMCKTVSGFSVLVLTDRQLLG